MDYQFLVELGIVLAFIAYSVKKVSEIAVKRANIQSRKSEQKTKEFRGIQSIVENPDEILVQLHKLRAEQIKEGATPEALKPLDDRIKQVEFIKKNQFWIQPIAPYADELIGAFVQGISKAVKSL